MIRSLPSSGLYRNGYRLYILLFFLFLVLPLIVISVLAFNDSNFISLPWKGFTLDWFFANTDDRVGLFRDEDLLRSIWISLLTAAAMASLSLAVGTAAALLFVQKKFRGKSFLYFLAIAPLVIPGVILGISILLSSTNIAAGIEKHFGWDPEFLSPGFWLVVLGQFSFGATYVMLIVSARLKKFDTTLEEAALSLRATRMEAIRYVTIPFLKPALISGFVVAFLISFSNFNTTIFLIGSDPTLPVELYSRIKFSSTPVLNAVSFMIVVVISTIAVLNLWLDRAKK
jgi:spermidine/putrescine transport system permease protein